MTGLSRRLAIGLGGSLTLALAIGLGRGGFSFTGEDMKVLGTRWAEPDMTVPEGMEYVRFPAPSAGPGIAGSVLVYTPEGYPEGERRYPVLYFLHGGMGSQRDVAWLLPSYVAAMKAGEMPPTIIVGVQGLPIGWWANARTGAPLVTSGPVEDVVVRDLVPFIDAHYRTVVDRTGRGLEGWSMGGFGALRLAFKHNDLFAHASSISGAVIEFEDEPMKQFVENTFGPADDPASAAFFDDVKPLTEARRNLGAILGRTNVRLSVGDQDWLYDKDGKKITDAFVQSIRDLGIDAEYAVVPGVGHDLPQAIAAGSVAYQAGFWAKAFAGL